MQCMNVFSVQEDGALATTLNSTRSQLHATCAREYFQRQSTLASGGVIVLNDSLAAEIVFLQTMTQHFSVECAGNYFQSQNMRKNSGAIVFNKRLP
eukprot:5469077-Karenia_brevis.AAC.1